MQWPAGGTAVAREEKSPVEVGMLPVDRGAKNLEKKERFTVERREEKQVKKEGEEGENLTSHVKSPLKAPLGGAFLSFCPSNS